MRVQNIVNNYQTRQNFNKQPAFGLNIICGLEKLSKGGLPDADIIKQNQLSGALVRLLEENGIKLPKKLLANTIFYARTTNKQQGIFIAIDKDTPQMKAAVAKLPPDIETRLSRGQPADIAGFIRDFVLKDPKTVEYAVWFEELESYSQGLLPATDILVKV